MAIDVKTDLARVRNIGIMAHIDTTAGATTTERVVKAAGRSPTIAGNSRDD